MTIIIGVLIVPHSLDLAIPTLGNEIASSLARFGLDCRSDCRTWRSSLHLNFLKTSEHNLCQHESQHHRIVREAAQSIWSFALDSVQNSSTSTDTKVRH